VAQPSEEPGVRVPGNLTTLDWGPAGHQIAKPVEASLGKRRSTNGADDEGLGRADTVHAHAAEPRVSDVEAQPPPDTAEARRRYARLARRYDRRIRLMAPIRRRVIQRMGLRPGDHVLDMGCGTGASFEALQAAIGPTGRITGVELSAEMASVARARTAAEGWTNVDIVVGDATAAPLPTGVDGVLFFLVHDLTRMSDVVHRAVAAGRPGARVTAFGPVRATHRLAAPVNAVVRAIARTYITTFEGFDAPWTHLADAVPDLRVHRTIGGGVYVASGEVRS
jgi:SAM-dependent methyltransferase